MSNWTCLPLICSLLLVPSAALAQAPEPPKAPAQATPKPATQAPKPATQAPEPVRPAAPAPQPARPAVQAPPAMRLTMVVTTTDSTGAPLPDVRVSATGPVMREGTTGKDGTLKLQGMRPGEYRLRLSAPDFITLERDTTVKAGTSAVVEASLNRSPAPERSPAASDVAPMSNAPVSPAAPPAKAAPPADANASVTVVSVVDWLSDRRNKLERGEGRKESQLAREAHAAVLVVQVRDALRDRSHVDADEVFYVITGSATLVTRTRQTPLEAGAVLLIPRGVTYTVENNGREPLWALSVLAPPSADRR